MSLPPDGENNSDDDEDDEFDNSDGNNIFICQVDNEEFEKDKVEMSNCICFYVVKFTR